MELRLYGIMHQDRFKARKSNYKIVRGMGETVQFNVSVPAGCKASFCALSHVREIYAGENTFSVLER